MKSFILMKNNDKFNVLPSLLFGDVMVKYNRYKGKLFYRYSIKFT